LTDTNGLQGIAQADIPPLAGSISLDTAPTGLQVSYNGQTLTTPVSFGDVAGMTRTLAVASATNPRKQHLQFRRLVRRRRGFRMI